MSVFGYSTRRAVISICVGLLALMTAFPPQIDKTYQVMDGSEVMIDQEVTYRFIAVGPSDSGLTGIYETSGMAYDRLALQWLVVLVVGGGLYRILSDDIEE